MIVTCSLYLTLGVKGSSIDAQQERIGKMELSEGAYKFNLSFDGLKPNTPYYLYVASSPNNYVFIAESI
ncbi:MAG: hypothetical protein UDG28_00330 [Prevotellamassilia sp.]|nr:hypothetical protein [Prevotellamassilia sp.]